MSTPTATGQRRLTAILMADVVGYSGLIRRRDVATIASLGECRALLSNIVAAQGGRVVGTQGDAFLAELPSSLGAVNAAIEIQRALARRNAVSAEDRLEYRVAVNLGDVIDDNGDIHGDGVNIAARLQAMAEPGGILVSGAIYDLVGGQADADFAFEGELKLKNISDRFRAYRATPRIRSNEPPGSGSQGAAPGEHRRPSIEIWRFRVSGRGAAARQICDMVADELTSLLSSISTIEVIRSDTAGLRVPGQRAGGAETKRDHYHLTGTGSVSDGRFRLNLQLVDAVTRRLVWSDRNELPTGDALRISDAIAREVATALQVTLTDGEHARLWSRGTNDSRAWELHQRGRHKEREASRSTHRVAQQLYRSALALDPSFMAAKVSLGYVLMDEIRQNWATDVPRTSATLKKVHRRALVIAPDYPDTHCLGAYIHVLERRYEEAIQVMRHAIGLSPGHAELIAHLGLIYAYAGKLDDAILCYEQAIRMNPYSHIWMRHNLAMAYRRSRRLPEALNVFNDVLKTNPGFVRSLVGLTSVLSRLGRLEEASGTAAEVMRLDPLFRVDDWAGRQPTLDQLLIDEIREDLYRAGLT